MCIWILTREFWKQIILLLLGECFLTIHAIKIDMCGIEVHRSCPFCMTLWHLLLELAEYNSQPSDFWLGNVFYFGQWNASGHDGSRQLSLHASCGLPTCLCLPTINHENNVSHVSRSDKNEKHMQKNVTWSADWNSLSSWPTDAWGLICKSLRY